MALLLALLVLLPLAALAEGGSPFDSRFSAGIAAVPLLAAIACGVTLVAALAAALLRAGATPRAIRRRLYPTGFLAITAAIASLLSIFVGGGKLDEVLFASAIAALAVLLAIATLDACFRFVGRSIRYPRGTSVPSPWRVAAALTPLALPAVGLAALRWLPGDPSWADHVAPIGQSGLVMACAWWLLPLAAVVVGFAIDRMLGHAATGIERAILALALLLLACAVAQPAWVPLAGHASYFRYSERLAGEFIGRAGGEIDPLPLARATAAMLLVCSTAVLVRARRSRRAWIEGVAPVVGIAVTLLLAAWLLPRIGPVAAPLAAAAGGVVMAVV